MKHLFRTLCMVCLIATSNLAAHATDYYLNCIKDNTSGECPLFSNNAHDWLKFTQTGENEYQLAVEHLCSNFYVDCVDDNNTIHMGTASDSETDQILSKSDCLSETGQTFQLVKDENSKSILKSAFTWDYVNIKHLLLTLTIGDEGNATLKIERLTNSNLKEGVPSIFYVTTEALNWNDESKADAAYRLIKGDGVNYNLHIESISDKVRIQDGLTHYRNPDCIILRTRNNGTRIDFQQDGDVYKLYNMMAGSDLIDSQIGAITKYEPITIDETTGKYTFSEDLFQETYHAGQLYLACALYNVDINFKYDIETADEKGYYRDEDTFISYDKGTAYEKTDELKYNGVLTIEYGDLTGTSTNFAVTLSKDGYDKEKAYVMTTTNEIKKDGSMYYIEYTCTIPGDSFNSAFYIKGYEGETLSTSNEITQYSGDSSESNQNLITRYTYTDGSGIISDIVEFYHGAYVNTAVVDTEFDGVPFYAINSSQTTIRFRYNIESPSESQVCVIIDDATLTGVDNMSVEGAEAPIEYYNMNGVRVDGSMPGLYIRRQGSNVSKVIIK